MSQRIGMPDHRERDYYQNCNLSSSPLKQINANERKARNSHPYRENCVPAQTKCNYACSRLVRQKHSQHRTQTQVPLESAASGNTDFTSFATGDVSDVRVPVRVNTGVEKT